jgi:hypothetical protein
MPAFNASPWVRHESLGAGTIEVVIFSIPQVSRHRIKLLDEIIAALVLSAQQQRQYCKR